MERSASIYGSSTALGGVQLKIGEKFKPPAKVTLPVGWKTRDPSRLLSLSYDFSLEEEVIQKVKAERQAREQQEHAQKVKEFVKTSTANPVMANMGGDILQPTTATTTTNSLNSTDDSKQFNYKDFEDNTDTPFEAVELQCINNMEALKSVLQPKVEADSGTSLGSTNIPSQMPQGTSSAQGIPIKGSTTQGNPHVSPHNLETHFPAAGSPIQVNNEYPPVYPDDPTNPFPPMYQDDPIRTQMGQTVSQNTNPFVTDRFVAENHTMDAQRPISTGIVSVLAQSNTVSYSAANTDRKIPPGAMRVLPAAPPARPPPRRPASVPNVNMTSEMMSAFPTHTEAPSTSAGPKRPVPKPRSKLPPLRNGPEESIYDVPTSLVPPPIPPKKSPGRSRNIEHAQKPVVSMDDVNLKRYPSPLPPISPPKQNHNPPPPINDPRSTMSPEEVQFVNQISAMGFPAGRVARAVKNLGCKEREVIEFLISVNDMCSKGYSEGQVEMVLKDNSDQTKAVEFLKLIVQFKELGFPEDKIFEALKKSECDSNKALDILTCAG